MGAIASAALAAAMEATAELAQIANRYKADFFTTFTNYPWNVAAVASGTYSDSDGEINHPGIIGYNSSTSANSGARVLFSGSPIIIRGGESSTAIIKTAATLSTITRRLFFCDTFDHVAPVDGVYCEIVDGTIVGKTANNSTRSTTATSFLLSANTFYRLNVTLNSDATLATFTLYADNSDTILWQDTLANNIPKTRTTGHGDIVTSSGTSAIALGAIDYLYVTLDSGRII